MVLVGKALKDVGPKYTSVTRLCVTNPPDFSAGLSGAGLLTDARNHKKKKHWEEVFEMWMYPHMSEDVRN